MRLCKRGTSSGQELIHDTITLHAKETHDNRSKGTPKAFPVVIVMAIQRTVAVAAATTMATCGVRRLGQRTASRCRCCPIILVLAWLPFSVVVSGGGGTTFRQR